MKKQILASLVIATLSTAAFALPQIVEQPAAASLVAEDGADRVGINRLAEGGSERTLERFRVAEDGADRVGINRLAEGGSERTLERFRVAEDGADRVGVNRIS